MGSISKSFSLLFIVLLAVSSLIIAKPASAQTPTPSVPVFTVQLVGPPYTIPTTYSLNQSSGQIVANIGYTNQYSFIVLTIKNQPYNPTYGTLYYNVREGSDNSWSYPLEPTFEMYDTYPTQSTDSDYTNISLPIGQISIGYTTGIQVEAMLGSINRNASLPGAPWEFEGATGAWSNTQTVSVPASIPLSPTPAPSSSTSTLTPTPTVTVTSVSSASYTFLLLIALVVIAFLLVVIIFLLIYMRKRPT